MIYYELIKIIIIKTSIAETIPHQKMWASL